MIDDFGTLLDDLGTSPITIRTFAAPTVNDYGETAAVYTDTVEAAVTHPAPRELVERHLGAERRGGEVAVHVRTPTALATSRDTSPPHVIVGERTYQIVAIEDYAAHGGVLIALGALLDP